MRNAGHWSVSTCISASPPYGPRTCPSCCPTSSSTLGTAIQTRCCTPPCCSLATTGRFRLPLVPPAAHRVQRPVRFLTQGDLALDVREHQIVRETRTTRMGLQQPCLPWGWVEPNSNGLIRAHRASPPTPSPHGAWLRGVRTVSRRTRSAPRSCRTPDRHPAPCHPPR